MVIIFCWFYNFDESKVYDKLFMLRILFPERSVLYSEQYLEVIIDCILSPVDTETDEGANEYKSVCRRQNRFAPQSVT